MEGDGLYVRQGVQNQDGSQGSEIVELCKGRDLAIERVIR